jgi:hypothetical protein
MSLGTILVIILIIFLVGGFSGRFRGYGYGYGHSGMGLAGVIFNCNPDPAAARQDLSR